MFYSDRAGESLIRKCAPKRVADLNAFPTDWVKRVIVERAVYRKKAKVGLDSQVKNLLFSWDREGIFPWEC